MHTLMEIYLPVVDIEPFVFYLLCAEANSMGTPNVPLNEHLFNPKLAELQLHGGVAHCSMTRDLSKLRPTLALFSFFTTDRILGL